MKQYILYSILMRFTLSLLLFCDNSCLFPAGGANTDPDPATSPAPPRSARWPEPDHCSDSERPAGAAATTAIPTGISRGQQIPSIQIYCPSWQHIKLSIWFILVKSVFTLQVSQIVKLMFAEAYHFRSLNLLGEENEAFNFTWRTAWLCNFIRATLSITIILNVYSVFISKITSVEIVSGVLKEQIKKRG